MSFYLEKCLRVGLQILLFFLPWQTVWLYHEPILHGFKWQFGTLGLYGTEILLFGCVAMFNVWFFLQFKKQKEKMSFRWSSDRLFLLSLGIFFLYCFASVLWSDNMALSLQQALRVLEAGLLFLMIFLGPISPRQTAAAFCVGLVWPVCLGVWQFLSQSTFASPWLGLSYYSAEQLGVAVVEGDQMRSLRAYGTFSHPNSFGGYLVVGLFFTTLRLLKERTSSVTVLWWHGLLLLQVMALFFTFSRAAWAGGVIVLVGYLYLFCQKQLRLNQNRIRVVTAFLVVVFIGGLSYIFAPLVLNRFSLVAPTEMRSVSERVVGYQEAIGLFQSNPWFGVGVGGYTARLHQLYPEMPGFALQPVHNTGFLVAVELGTVGMILLGWIFVCFWRLLRQKQRRGWVVVSIFGSLLPLIPLLLLDHYIWTALPVLLAVGAFFGVFFRCFYTDFPHLVHFFPQKLQTWLS